jgi:branched-subunit amino acid transport protein
MRLLALFAAMGMVTYVPRVLPLLALAGRRLPPLLVHFCEGFPVAVLAAFVVPLVLAPGGKLALDLNNLELIVAVPTTLVAMRTRSLIAAVVAGSAFMILARVVVRLI